MKKKKPCPFCGSKRLFVSKSDCSWHEPAFAYSVGCAGADCHGHIFALGHDLFKTENEAIEAWNERAVSNEIEKLRAALRQIRDQEPERQAWSVGVARAALGEKE